MIDPQLIGWAIGAITIITVISVISLMVNYNHESYRKIKR